eukprot:TRINITY_DN2683_c0_g1_i1.p1 TRINITY_DN2683_c0_g1~~TRINITY_DN2683_c0_g1_i1.p1  ORF type:complete len:322 (+),score=106.59 TRINITY_DN2683_c0_g1_i1:52-1017(+)
MTRPSFANMFRALAFLIAVTAATASLPKKQMEPCFWTNVIALEAGTANEFFCTGVADGSSVSYTVSSVSGYDEFRVLVLSDAAYTAWRRADNLTAEAQACVNSGDCHRADAYSKAGSYNIGAAGSPYRLVVVNTADGKAAADADFDVVVSVSVGEAEIVDVVTLTGNPPPPPPPNCNTTCVSCYSDMCCNIPCNNEYVLTSFCNGETGPMACGGTCQAPKSQWFTADKQRFGCNTVLNVCAGGQCIKGMALDAGPGASVEKRAGMPVLDAYFGFCQSLFGQSSCGWSDHHVVTVTPNTDNRPFGPFTPTPEEYERIINQPW